MWKNSKIDLLPVSDQLNDPDSITPRLVVRGKNKNDQVEVFKKGFIEKLRLKLGLEKWWVHLSFFGLQIHNPS